MTVSDFRCAILETRCLPTGQTTLDKNLNVNYHVAEICKKAGQNLHALARVAKFMDQEKVKTVMNALYYLNLAIVQ